MWLFIVGVASSVYSHVQLCHVTFTRSPPLYYFIRATSCTGLPATGEVTEVYNLTSNDPQVREAVSYLSLLPPAAATSLLRTLQVCSDIVDNKC